MIVKPKFKEHWALQPDNSQLQYHPTDDQVYHITKFTSCDWQTHKQNLYSLFTHLSTLQQPNPQITKIDTPEQLSLALTQLQSEPYIVAKCFSQTRLSYKGFISWIILGNSNNFYLIDALILRNHMLALRTIFQNSAMIKLVIGWAELVDSLKRDFGIVSVNLFDMVCLEAQYQSLGHMGAMERQQTAQQLAQNPQLLIQRPLKPKTQKLLTRTLTNLLSYLQKLPYSPPTTSTSSPYYYQHLFYRYHQLNQPQPLLCYYQHQQTQCLTKQQLDNLNPRREKLYYALLEFREHVGKMYDVGVGVVLPKGVVLGVVMADQGISVLEISDLYQANNCTSVGLELCKRIYDVIQLNQQQFEDSQMLTKQIFQKQLTSKKQPIDQSNIKKLLKDIQWGDSNQWLNRKDDVSIKLYKEIISISEFDYSIGEEYINMMKGDVLKKTELGKYLKYAQYMRNRNYQKLENLYKMSLLIKESKKIDQFSEETEGEKKEKDNYDHSDQYGKKIEPMSQRQLKSSTSLEEKMPEKQLFQLSKIKSEQRKMHSLTEISRVNAEESSQSRSRKSSETSSINLLELDQMNIKRSDIRPLPNSIQQIYELAQEVKKKTDKKTKKKQKKAKNETNKDTDFIPTWQDIQYVMNLANNDNLK